jgi:hypothetical protein
LFIFDIIRTIKERKMAQTMSATHILEQLWACRERDLLQKISESRDLEFEDLLSEFGNSQAKKGVVFDMNVHSGDSGVNKSRKSGVPVSERCKARVWNGGKGGQCTRRGCKGPGNDLCGNHARCLEEKGVLPQGRVDEDVPENMLSSGDSTPKSVEGKAPEVLEGGLNEKDLDVALQELTGEVEEGALDLDSLSEFSSVKKKRGRPKGSKKKSVDPVVLEPNAEIQELGAEIQELSFDTEGNVISQSDISAALLNYLDGADLTKVNLSTAKKAIHTKLSINKEDYDTKWFKTEFSKMKKVKEEDLKVEKEVTQQVVEKTDEGDGVEDEEEEVACSELEVGGIVYLLDSETLKVYARESPNGFVGKYDGNAIDFDAIDSDDEEE